LEFRARNGGKQEIVHRGLNFTQTLESISRLVRYRETHTTSVFLVAALVDETFRDELVGFPRCERTA